MEEVKRIDMESWDKEKIMSLTNDDLLLYINYMLSQGWSMGKLQERTGVRRQTIRDRLKKDGYIYNSEANAYLKPLLEQEDITTMPVKASETPRKAKKSETDVITLEMINKRLDTLEKAVADVLEIKDEKKATKHHKHKFEALEFEGETVDRLYPLHKEVIDLIHEVRTIDKKVKVKDIINTSVYIVLSEYLNKLKS